MMTTERNSLLGLPAELRVRIYRHLFSTTWIRLRVFEVDTATEDDLFLNSDELTHEYKSEPLRADQTSIDDGVTLVCALLRKESLPVLRRSVKLCCELDGHFSARADLCIKAEFRELIREAHLVFETEALEVPLLELPSLEILHLECDPDWDALTVRPTYDVFLEWARSKESHKYVEFLKDTLHKSDIGYSLDEMLADRDRGFSVTWRDQVVLVSDPTSSEIFWLTFDWDSLAIFEGASDIQLDYLRTIEQAKVEEEEEGTGSEQSG